MFLMLRLLNFIYIYVCNIKVRGVLSMCVAKETFADTSITYIGRYVPIVPTYNLIIVQKILIGRYLLNFDNDLLSVKKLNFPHSQRC